MPNHLTFRRMKQALPWIVLSMLVIAVDQVSKYMALSHLDYARVQPVFSWLNFYLQYNQGASFSFLSEAGGWQIYALSVISIAVSIYILNWLLALPRSARLQCVALSLILGGAIGNLMDRVRFQYVIDFIDFHMGTWHFATFNIADTSISVGAFLLVVSLMCRAAK